MADDPRITNQESYLMGSTLRGSRRKAWWESRPSWDHDHCESRWTKFGWTKFGSAELAEESDEKVLTMGFVTKDDYHWICEERFRDFRDRFEWTVDIAGSGGRGGERCVARR